MLPIVLCDFHDYCYGWYIWIFVEIMYIHFKKTYVVIHVTFNFTKIKYSVRNSRINHTYVVLCKCKKIVLKMQQKHGILKTIKVRKNMLFQVKKKKRMELNIVFSCNAGSYRKMTCIFFKYKQTLVLRLLLESANMFKYINIKSNAEN